METRLETLKPENELQASPAASKGVSAAYQLLGAIKAAGLISRSISAEAIKSLQAIRDEKLYLEFGAKSFDEFLDKDPEAPMSYYQFLQREKLLTSEGPLAFQLLNTLRIPLAQRKLLKAGEVNVFGDEVEINGEKFPISNGVEIRKLIVGILEEKSEIDRENTKQKETIERGKKEMDRKKRQIGELEDQLAHGGVSVEGTSHGRALATVLGDMAVLAQELEKITDAEEQKLFGVIAIERVTQMKLQLEQTLGFTPATDELPVGELD